MKVTRSFRSVSCLLLTLSACAVGEDGQPGAMGAMGEMGAPGAMGMMGEKGEKGNMGVPGLDLSQDVQELRTLLMATEVRLRALEEGIVRVPAMWCVSSAAQAMCDRTFASPQLAFDALRAARLVGDGELTILIDGTFELAEPLELSHPDGSKLRVLGAQGSSSELRLATQGAILSVVGERLGLLGRLTLRCTRPSQTALAMTAGGIAEIEDLQTTGCDVGVNVDQGSRLLSSGSLAIGDGASSGARGLVVRRGSSAVLADLEVTQVATAVTIRQASLSSERLVVSGAIYGLDLDLASVEIGNTRSDSAVSATQSALNLSASTVYVLDGLTVTVTGTIDWAVQVLYGSVLWLENADITAPRAVSVNKGAAAVIQQSDIRASEVAFDQHLGGRLFYTRGAAPRVIAGRSEVTSDGEYCGATAQVSMASLGSYAAARDRCASQCASPTAHVCSGAELVRTQEMQPTNLPNGWYSTGLRADDTGGGAFVRDCQGFSTVDGHGAVWLNGLPNDAACSNTSYPLLCCDW